MNMKMNKQTQSQKTAQELVAKTFEELFRPKKPQAKTRVWESSNAYIHLIAWSNASLLRILGTKWFDYLKSSKSPLTTSRGSHFISRLEGQFLDELRSVVANIEEGFARPTTAEYLTFLGYSQASLKEAKGDVQRMRQDGILKSKPSSSLKDLRINLKKWHEALKKSVVSVPIKESRGRYRKLKDRGSSKLLQGPITSFKFFYLPVDNLDPQNLTYEIFIELVNKTDWHLRRLVESLEKKLLSDKKGYQIDKARIRDRLSWKK